MNVIRSRVFFGTWLALGAIAVTLVRGELTDEEKKKRDARAKAREKMRAIASPTPEESPEPTAKPKPAKRKAKASKSPTPKPTETPEAKKKPTPESDDETPTPKPNGKHLKKKATTEKTPTPKPKTRIEKAEPAKTPAAPDNPPKAIAVEPVRSPSVDSSPPPRAIPVPPTTQPLPPSDITIEKSGLEQEQGLEPTPPPPVRRGFWPWSRRVVNYRYLTSATIDAIRRAPVQRARWKFIIVHNSGTRQGNARAFEYYHRHVRRMRNGLAYHFVIGNGTSSRDGQIEIGDRWARQINGGHVHSDYLNNIALGICLVGDFNRDQPTRAQLEACEELIRYLRERCGKSDGRVAAVRPHREVNPPQWATDCPGDAFPYGWFRRF